MDFLTWLFVAILATMVIGYLTIYFMTSRKKVKGQFSTLIILGSGGHTSEMLKMTSALNKDKYQPRTYIRADTDKLSEVKASKPTRTVRSS